MTRVLAQKPVSALTPRTPVDAVARHEASNEEFEEEADRAAERAIALPSTLTSAASRPEERARAGVPPGNLRAVPESVTRTLAEPGSPLEPELRRDMERRFGHDFSQVRVHAGRAAGDSALDVNAQAYTAGQHIVFGTGNFAPTGHDGRRLIAHELAHVIQQSPRNGATVSSRVLQRKPRTDGAGAQDETTADPRTTNGAAPGPDAAVVELQAAVPDAPLPAEATAAAPQVRDSPARATPPQPDVRAAPRARAPSIAPRVNRPPPPAPDASDIAPREPTTDTKPPDTSPIPPLRTLLSDPQPGAAAADSPTSPDEPSRESGVDLSGLLRTLALGAREARATLSAHSRSSLPDVDWSARRSSQQLAEQTRAADEGVRKLASRRRAELDKTILAHDWEIRWAEKNYRDGAKSYTDHVKAALTDGFAASRKDLGGVFDGWVQRFAALYDRQAEHLGKWTDYYVKMAMRMSRIYDRDFVESYRGQSEERKRVQEDAAFEVADSYVETIRKGYRDFLPDLQAACTQAKPELEKTRDQALLEFDKGLPDVLRGIDAQYSAATLDISTKAEEARAELSGAAIKMHARVTALEAEALERNAAFRAKIEADIESGHSSASRSFARAADLALRPIAGTLDEAVGLLTSGTEAIDEDAAEQFVDEVVGFSMDAAEATGVVFGAARDASVAKLASAVPFARRGLTAARQGLEAALHSEGAEDETRLIEFSTNVDADLKASLTALDATYQAGVTEAQGQLSKMISDTYTQLHASMDPTVEKIKDAVWNVTSEENKGFRALSGQMTNAGRQAAWRYDHPYLKYAVDTLVVAAGFIAAIAIAVAVVVGLPLLLGAEAAAVVFAILAVVGAFCIGYFGAQRYYERREAGESVLSSVFGAIGDVTGITDAYHGFTDSKMSPFDRGMAWGGFWLNLLGAAEAAPRFLRAIKVHLPKTFTNPFRLKGSMFPRTLPEEGMLPALTERPPTIPEPRNIGFELPNPQLPEGEIPQAPATPKPARKIGFELPNTQLPEGEIPQAPAAPMPARKIGFELPHEQIPATEVPAPGATGGAPAPDTTPSLPKEPIGFKKPGENLPAQPTPETPAIPERRKIGFERPNTQLPEGEIPETPAAPKPDRKIGFELPHEQVPPTEAPAGPIDAPSGTKQQPGPGGNTPEPGGVISQMPPAKQVPNSPPPAGGVERPTTNRPTGAMGGSTPETPTHAGDQTPGAGSPAAGSPTKGSVISTVDADLPAPTRTEPALSPQAEARLADEQAVQAAHERRLAAEERVKELQERVHELDEMDKELGRKRKRDYIHDAHDQAKAELKQGASELRKSQRAEAEAEARERLDLKRRKDIDPAAVQHDPLLKEQAEAELARRQARVAENNKLIRANDADLADAQAKVATREKEFENTRQGNDWTESGRALKRERELARESLDSANRHLESVQNRTAAAEAANEKHARRMQDLDRQLHPEKYPEMTGDKGDFAENENHKVRNEEGYAFRGSSKEPKLGKPKDQGLDGVYEKMNPKAEGAKHVVDEVKYDTARLREGQETAAWVDERLDTAVGPAHANKMRAEGYEYRVRKWDPKSRTFRETKLWEWRPTGQKGPGGKILGKPYYLTPSP